MSVVELHVDDRGVATVTLNRPDVRNAFDDELIRTFTQTFSELPAQVRAVVLRGEGRVFSAGADLNWMRGMAGYSREDNLADSHRLREMLDAVDTCPAPVVARVHGAAMAGAAGLVACCDVAVAEQGTVFAFTEVRLGLIPAVISPYVVRKVGYAFARAAFLTGERFDARRAYDAGLVHRVVGDDDLDTAVQEVVDAFLAAGPAALRGTRQLLDAVWGRSPAEVADITVSTIADARVSDEGQEGVAAFFERRRPRWA